MNEEEGSKDKGPKPSGEPGWERSLLERLAFASLDEQRKRRRWGLIKFFVVIGLVVTMFSLSALLRIDEYRSPARFDQFTAIVELEGIIMPDSEASADYVVTGLRNAFEAKGSIGVIVRANSPGGSPVQSAYINDEIQRLREKYPDKPVYAVITDVCASGCYYAVVAADKIYANPSSIVGSIGVLMNGFGFVDAMKKLGIERRLLTAGEHKGILDPFSPVKPYDEAYAKRMLREIHKEFIERVRSGRGEALKEDKETFSGLFWTGMDAKKMGLIDDFGSASYVAREIIGAENLVDFTYRESFFDRFARRVGTSIGEMLATRMGSLAPQLR